MACRVEARASDAWRHEIVTRGGRVTRRGTREWRGEARVSDGPCSGGGLLVGGADGVRGCGGRCALGGIRGRRMTRCAHCARALGVTSRQANPALLIQALL